MKKFCIIFLLSIIISVTTLSLCGCFTPKTPVTSDYLRIHIRADSNDQRAQAVKYRVRDALIEYLTPLVASFESKAQAISGVKARLTEIERVAENTLLKGGFDYGAAAQVTTERFPTRVYGEYTLQSGEYTALIVSLGRGEGDNWWCVVYPPLCFSATQGQNVVYKSKILEIIQRWKDA